jgi:serine/threonine protein kinase
MSPERWSQVKQVFYAALERQAADRAVYLDGACRGDDEMRREVDSLLDAHGQPSGLIDKPAFEVAADLEATREFAAAIGRALGPYKILEQIGRGGMGEVYLAQDIRLGRRVALKLLPSRFTSDEARLRRFKQEARAASSLNHPNIITIHEVGQVDDAHFIATEFVDGLTLRSAIKSDRIGTDQALDITIQVASALRAAHEAGIVHRDIKPENIMLRPDGYVKVLDFGLAKLTQRGQASGSGEETEETVKQSDLRTQTGVVMGTVKYMSPEQARGEKIDHRTDIFSLGVVLYEAVTGQAPFDGETASHTIVAILEREPKPLAEYVPGAPGELQRIIDKALHKKREDRYQTMREMMDELQEVREEVAYRARQQRHSDTSATVLHTESIAGTTGQIVKGRSRVILWAAIVMVAVIGFGFGVYEYIKAKRGLSSRSVSRPTPSSQSVKINRVTANGRIWGIAISSDGKHIAYAAGPFRQQSLWIMRASTASHAQVIPPADEAVYWGLTFSPEGDYIYYVMNVGSGPWELYRVPTVGGTPKRLLVNVDSAVTFSPDGQRMAFGRVGAVPGESSLVVTNVDGTNEDTIATRTHPDFYDWQGLVRIAWSPDGESIACPVGNKVLLGSNRNELVAVSVKDRAEKPLTRQTWWGLRQVAWLGDGSGLVLVGNDQPSSPSQVWHLSYPSGEVRRLTNDLSSHVDLSVTADSSTIATVQGDRLSNVWVATEGKADRAIQITDSRNDGFSGISWTPGARIVYCSNVSGNPDIWIMDADGGNRKRLTEDPHLDEWPSVSGDGRYIVFVSNRAGKRNIWRMDMDGGHPVQLTSGNGEYAAYCAPDGLWLYYTGVGSGKNPVSVWKVPINGGEPVLVIDKHSRMPIISPDQRLLAFVYSDLRETPPYGIAIAPVEGGPLIKRLAISHEGGVFHWTPDGRALAYIDHRSLNVWAQPIEGGKPTQLTNFKSDQTFNFAWSRDGKQLALARGTLTSDVVLISDFK